MFLGQLHDRFVQPRFDERGTAATQQDGGRLDAVGEPGNEPPGFSNPGAFNSCIAQSCWESFTVTLQNPEFFDAMAQFSGNEAGTGGPVTFKD